MLSAFQLENNRLTRLEVEESQPLVNAVWGLRANGTKTYAKEITNCYN